MDNQVYTQIPASEPLPLCVDLDGTLVRTDTLFDTFITAARKISTLVKIPFWLIQGKAKFKANLAQEAGLDAALLPYNGPLLAYLHEQKSRGRYLVLATAANQSIAHKVNQHLRLFDEIIASDETQNLRGEKKAEALAERFGTRGFDYIGNSRIDLSVWKYASSGILVNVSDHVAKRAEELVPIEKRFTDNRLQERDVLKALRPHQWMKNMLVFIPIITAGAFIEPSAILNAVVLFAAFCCTASGIYIVNDLYDLEADRQHPRKCQRPFASGSLSLGLGFILAPILIILGIAFAGALASAWTMPLILCYGLLSITYSVKLKELPLVDVFTLAGLYTLRLFAGGEATGYHVSFWLLAFSGFIFLALAIVKRTSELSSLVMIGRQEATRRGYTTSDINILKMFGISSTFVSSLVVALYIHDQAAKAVYEFPHLLWFIVPLMLLWQCRIWLSTERGYMQDDPIVYAGKDWVSWCIGILVMAVIVMAHIRW